MNLDFIIGIVTIIGIIYIIYRDGIKDKIEIENRFAKIEEKLINYAKNYEKQETKTYNYKNRKPIKFFRK